MNHRMAALMAVVAVAALAACGGPPTEPSVAANSPSATPEIAETPLPSPISLSADGTLTIVAGGAVDGPGNDIADALSLSLSEAQLVNGTLLRLPDGALWLCSAEPAPDAPCPGPRLEVHGLTETEPLFDPENADAVGMEEADGLRWIPAYQAFGTVESSRAEGGIPPDSLARVVTNDLVVRSLPEISDRSVIDPVFLQEGQYLFVLEGPVPANGYDWYRVAPFDPRPGDTPPEPVPLLGWVAAGSKDGEPWIAADEATCAAIHPDGNGFWLPNPAALACLGDREIVVEGTLDGCAGIIQGTVEPVWLAEAACGIVPRNWGIQELGPNSLGFHLVPSAPALPPADASIRIVGHLDDPAAQRCRVTGETGGETPPPEIVVLNCRSAFAVTEVTLLDR